MAQPLKLTVLEGDDVVSEASFEQPSVKLGRWDSADLRIDDDRVNRLHAVINAVNGSYELLDMGSAHGTVVNGERISKRRLAHGDQIGLGRFRVEVGLDAQAQAATTADVVEVHDEPVNLAGVSGLHEAPAPSAATPTVSPGSAGRAPPPVPDPVEATAAGGPSAPWTPGQAAYGVAPVAPAAAPLAQSGVPAAGHPAAPLDPALAAPVPVAAHPSGHGAPFAPWAAPPSVPNNLASASVPDDQRALEVKLVWAGGTVLETLNVTDQPRVTMGDEKKVSGFGPLQRLIRCDLEVPSRGLPGRSHVLARRQGRVGATYLLDLPPGLVGRIERADGTAVPLELIYAGQYGGQPDGAGGAQYLLNAEETVYLGYESMVIQLRYVRRTRLLPVPVMERINYAWANILLLAAFFHVATIGSFIATPDPAVQLTDELDRGRNRFIETRLALVEKKKQEGGNLLKKLTGPAEKAKDRQGRAGKKSAKKANERLASKGKPDEREQARRALDKLIGLGGKGARTGLFGGRGLGGELESAMGGLRGREVGDARGLGGLGTRGTGIGGGGLSTTSVGIGKLGTAGRGGGGIGGAGYGAGAASLGGKRERDVEITAGQAIVRGSLSKEIIRRVIEKHRAQIRYCYEKELQRSPGLYGKVATEFIIAASGEVSAAKVKQSTMSVPEVGRCITAKIRTWRFPKPKGGGIVVVNYPFLFKASG